MNNLTVIIVSFHSENKIFDCINSINKDVRIVVIENSNNQNLKKKLELTYSNVICILSKQNLGYGAGNNLGLSMVDTDYALILNPDVVLNIDTLDNFNLNLRIYPDFGIIAPISKNEEYDNFNFLKDQTIKEVKYVKGFAMFFNMKKVKEINFFDENFFLYFEEIDLCKRLNNRGIKMFIDPSMVVNHFGGASHDSKVNKQMELSRNWHWMWSTFYYHKKHFGYTRSILKVYPKLFSSLFKFLIYLLIFRLNKSAIYKYRFLGLINSILLKNSWYRPKF